MSTFRGVMEWVGIGFDAMGVVVVTIGALLAAWRSMRRARSGAALDVRAFRQEFGAAIVLGLEFLVAGDIIRTVVVAPTLENVAVLAIIVLVRTVLSMALQVEIEGRWPWQRREAARLPSSPASADGTLASGAPPDPAALEGSSASPPSV